MARRALGPATLEVVRAVERVLDRPALVACSGGADSLALAAAASLVGERTGTAVRAAVIDHGLQAGSAGIAAEVSAVLAGLGLTSEVVRVVVDDDGLAPLFGQALRDRSAQHVGGPTGREGHDQTHRPGGEAGRGLRLRSGGEDR